MVEDTPANPAIIRGLYEAFARGDVSAVLQALAPNVSWTEAEGFPHGGTYRGPQSVLENVFIPLGAEWQSFSAAPEEFVAQGDTVVSLGSYEGVFKATGKRFASPFAHVWTLRGGKVVRFRQLTDTALVQRALQ